MKQFHSMSTEPAPAPTSDQAQSQPTSKPSTPGPGSGPTPAKTPVTLHPTSHLDPSAYVRGHNAITINSNVLIHPRAHLISTSAPISIGEGSIIAEKSVVGGPITPPSASSSSSSLTSSTSTEIGRHVHVHGNVSIHAGCKVGSFSVIEANVVVKEGVVIGRHSKICAGVTVIEDVPEWTVVFGGSGVGGQRRRRRKVRGSVKEDGREGEGEGGAEMTETLRLEAMAKEREGTMAILRAVAAKNIAMKAKR